MAKIDRKYQKQFADLGWTGNLGVFGSYAAGSPAYSSDPDVIQSLAAFGAGVSSALINDAPPAIQDMDGIGNLLTRQLRYLFQTGIPLWVAGATYYTGSLVSDDLGSIYISQTGNNTGNALSSTDNWMLLYSKKSRAVTLASMTDYVATYDDYIILVGGTSGTPAPYIFLPAASSTNKGRVIIVKKLITTASGELRVVAGNGTQNIDGTYPNILTTLYTVRKYISNGTDWNVI